MRALVCLVAVMLPSRAVDLGELDPLIDRLRAEPDDRRTAVRAISGVLRPWLDEVIAPHGYSPGPATLASKLNTELATALGPERVCGSERHVGCIGAFRILDLREPYFMVVKTAVWLGCGFEEAAYLYEWANARWIRRLAIDDEPTATGPPRQFDYFDLSPADAAGRHVMGSAALLRDCEQPNTAIAEMRVYAFDDRSTRRVVFDSRAVLPDAEPITVHAESSAATFEVSVQSINREPETRRAIHTYALGRTSARRVQPVAHTVRSFVEEWLTTPWREAAAWSRPEPEVAQAHGELAADDMAGEFLPTTGCEEQRTFQVGIRNLEIRVLPGLRQFPEVYFKIQATGHDTYLVADVSTEPDETCE